MMILHWISTMSDAAVAAAAEPAASTLVGLPLMSKGLLTTAFGLLGVFLVLGLFFATIKVMQRIKSREGEE